MKIISDTHFFHKNIIKFSNRPFDNVSQMNEYIIEKWNENVSPNDTIYHLGDFAFGGAEEVKKLIVRLNGKKVLILGNHDRTATWYLNNGFAEVYKILQVGDKILIHDPYRIPPIEEISSDIKYVLYGHLHEKIYNPPSEYDGIKFINSCVEFSSYAPFEF